jgi:hypothetical protein
VLFAVAGAAVIGSINYASTEVALRRLSCVVDRVTRTETRCTHHRQTVYWDSGKIIPGEISEKEISCAETALIEERANDRCAQRLRLALDGS